MGADLPGPSVQAALDDLSDAFDRPPDFAALRGWLDRHPAYRDAAACRDALLAFVARWSVTDLRADAAPAPADDARIGRDRAIVARVIAELAATPIAGLLAQARAVDLAAPEAAARAGLSVPLLAQLDRRLVRFESLPDALFARLAEAIGRTAADVRAYLAGPPLLPRGAQFRADHAPVAAAGTQDFFDAIRADPLLPETEKARWLALAPTEDGGA